MGGGCAKRASRATLPPAPHASGQVIFDSIRTWKVRQFQRALLNARGRGSVNRGCSIEEHDPATEPPPYGMRRARDLPRLRLGLVSPSDSRRGLRRALVTVPRAA